MTLLAATSADHSSQPVPEPIPKRRWWAEIFVGCPGINNGRIRPDDWWLKSGNGFEHNWNIDDPTPLVYDPEWIMVQYDKHIPEYCGVTIDTKTGIARARIGFVRIFYGDRTLKYLPLMMDTQVNWTKWKWYLRGEGDELYSLDLMDQGKGQAPANPPPFPGQGLDKSPFII